MIYKGENVSIYRFYENVYKEDGLKWALKIFYCQIRVFWHWRIREEINVRVYLFKEKVERGIEKGIKKVF